MKRDTYKIKKLKDLVLFENEDLVVFNKPPMWTCGVDRALEGANSFTDLVNKHYGKELLLCHRLDKSTSGCLVMAKTEEAHRDLNLQFQNRAVAKTYHALIGGTHYVKDEVLRFPVHKSGNKIASINYGLGKEAITEIATLEAFQHYTLLSCFPQTGRFHQIRIHLAHTKRPIVGDALYKGPDIFLSNFKPKFKNRKKPSLEAKSLDGRTEHTMHQLAEVAEKRALQEEKPIIERTALHAYELKFKLPGSNDTKTFQADYPKDFNAAVKQLRKYDK